VRGCRPAGELIVACGAALNGRERGVHWNLRRNVRTKGCESENMLRNERLLVG